MIDNSERHNTHLPLQSFRVERRRAVGVASL
jgi:hypothetical protein